MAAIKLTAFTGEQPRILPRLLPDTAAQEAFDVRLDDGGLTPMRSSVQAAEALGVNHKTIIRHAGTWLSFEGVVSAAPGPVAGDRLYYTGDGAPKMRVNGSIYDLAVPRPANELTAAVSGTGDGDVATRVYVYTWVTEFGEESEPTKASNEVDWQPGQTVTLSGFAMPPPGRNILTQRIYRSQTGSVGTYLYFIAERPITTDDFIDDVPVDAFQEPLPSADWQTPPDDLSGLISLPNGMMAGFSGKDLYFCEPWRPHAWPEKYVATMDWPIVGLGAIGTSIVVMTTGQPYLMTGSHPANMVQTKIEQNLPCINARGIVDLGFVICYPSQDGLVAVQADGGTRLVTGNLFGRDDWRKLSPETAIGSQIGGRYVLFYDTIDVNASVVAGALFIDVGGTPYLMRSSARASAAFYDLETSALYFLRHGTNQIFQLDPSIGAKRKLHWRSKEFVLPSPQNFGAIRVDAQGVMSPEEIALIEAQRQEVIDRNQATLALGEPLRGELNGHALNEYFVGGDLLEPVPGLDFDSMEVGVVADDRLVATISTASRPVRLPAGFRARRWEITVQSRVTIEQIILAPTIADIQNTP